PAHQGRGPPRFRLLWRRGITQPGCSSKGRHEPSPGRGPCPIHRHPSSRSRPGTASLPFVRWSATRCYCVTTAKGKVRTRCLPGARVLDVSAHVPAILNKNVRAVVLHAGTNDIRLRQTEILKKDFRSLVEKARTTSPMTRIIMSGPLPTFQQGIERFRVYIPPSANAKEALCELYRAISKLQNSHLDGLFIIAGDFNHANLKSVLPKFHQYVNFATRGVNALDLVYTNIPGTYRAEPSPHLGYSDHISVMLILAYRPLVRSSKSVLEQVKTWPE
ncbi:hypothetical protein QTP86_017143, partial [Hemibagrus guttatus]